MVWYESLTSLSGFTIYLHRGDSAKYNATTTFPDVGAMPKGQKVYKLGISVAWASPISPLGPLYLDRGCCLNRWKANHLAQYRT
jgi:hypothetical protein